MKKVILILMVILVFPVKAEQLLNTLEFTNVSYEKSSEDWCSELTLKVNLTNENGLSGYSFNNEEFTLIEGTTYEFQKEITINGVYEIKVQDKSGKIESTNIEIDNIDNIAPVISSFSVSNKDRYSVLKVEAVDNESGLSSYSYSFDNQATWSNKATFEVIKNGEYFVYVKDKVGNISSMKTMVSLNGNNQSTVNNIIYGEVNEKQRKVTISLLNSNDTKIAISKNEPLESELTSLTNAKFITFLEEGDYYIWLKDGDTPLRKVSRLEVRLSNRNTKISLPLITGSTSIILILLGIIVLSKFRKNKV